MTTAAIRMWTKISRKSRLLWLVVLTVASSNSTPSFDFDSERILLKEMLRVTSEGPVKLYFQYSANPAASLNDIRRGKFAIFSFLNRIVSACDAVRELGTSA